jgi:hypothetical protein
MMVEIKVVLTPFMAFASISNVAKARNMIAIQKPKCSKNICWKGQSYTNDGKI